MHPFRIPLSKLARILITASTVVTASAAAATVSTGRADAGVAHVGAPSTSTSTLVAFTDTTKKTDWSVPQYVTSIHVQAIGGAGSDGTGTPHGSGGSGGFGGIVDADLTVVPGEALTVAHRIAAAHTDDLARCQG